MVTNKLSKTQVIKVLRFISSHFFSFLSFQKTLEWVVSNSTAAIRSSIQGVLKRYERKASDILICAEYTGTYAYPPGCACDELHTDLWMENAAQIKHSSGLNRGKNDKPDARKIAACAIRFQDKVHLFSLPEKETGKFETACQRTGYCT
jgi:transposase